MTTGQTARSRAADITARQAHHLYRCYDADGVLLYIGITTDPRRRFSAHMAGLSRTDSVRLAKRMASFDVDADAYRNKDAARTAEAEAIRVEQPLLNHQDRCVPGHFIKAQIADYDAGLPVRQWPIQPPHAKRAS